MIAGLALALAAASFGSAAPVPDPVLATMRGGIMLANGLDVAIGVAIETRIDGQLALRSQLTSAATGVQVYSGGAPTVVATGIGTGGGVVALPAAQVLADRAATGTQVIVYPSVTVGPVSVGSAATWTALTAGTALPLTQDGPGVAVPLGTVVLRSNGDGSVAELTGSGINIRQFIGAATGVIVANTASNRVIDTTTSVNIDLSGVIVPANFTSAIESVTRAVGSRVPF